MILHSSIKLSIKDPSYLMKSLPGNRKRHVLQLIIPGQNKLDTKTRQVQNKGNFRLILLMNIEARILNKI